MEKTTKEVLQMRFETYKDGFSYIVNDRVAIGKINNPEDAELICKAVNKRQKLLDSNRELKMELEKWQNWFKNPEMGPRDLLTAADIYETAKTAINNAKNNQP